MPFARAIQRERFGLRSLPTSEKLSDIVCNADMRIGEVMQFCQLQACPEQRRRDEGDALSVSKGQSLMRAAMSQLKLSARGYHRTQSVKLARTLADLAASGEIQVAHLVQVLHLR